MEFDHTRATVSSEWNFANKLCTSICAYWRAHGYDIEAHADKPVKIAAGERNFRAPIFPIRSNIGPYGYPPKRPAVI